MTGQLTDDELEAMRSARLGGTVGEIIANDLVNVQRIHKLIAEVDRLRAHAQQVEVPHSSAAVLGYSVAQESGYDSSVGWEVIDDHQEIVQLGTFEQSSDVGLHGCVRVAVVRVGADGRIGS